MLERLFRLLPVGYTFANFSRALPFAITSAIKSSACSCELVTPARTINSAHCKLLSLVCPSILCLVRQVCCLVLPRSCQHIGQLIVHLSYLCYGIYSSPLAALTIDLARASIIDLHEGCFPHLTSRTSEASLLRLF